MVPNGVNATIDGQKISIKGPKGELSVVLIDDVEAQMTDAGITLISRGSTKRARSMWGMSRTLVSNLVDGVTQGYEKSLEIIGVGYRAQVQGKNLQLQLGFSHCP